MLLPTVFEDSQINYLYSNFWLIVLAYWRTKTKRGFLPYFREPDHEARDRRQEISKSKSQKQILSTWVYLMHGIRNGPQR